MKLLQFSISILVQHIIHDMLKLSTVSAGWLSRQPTPDLKERCFDAVNKFYDALMEKVMASYEKLLRAMSLGSSTTSRKLKEKASNGAVLRYHN